MIHETAQVHPSSVIEGDVKIAANVTVGPFTYISGKIEIGEGTEGKWDLALEPGKLLAAVNQSIVPLDTEVKEGDEVAFFPPVTGG